MRRKQTKIKHPIGCVASPSQPRHPVPRAVKNRTLGRVQVPRGKMLENPLRECKSNSPVSQFKIKRNGVEKTG